MKIIVIIFYLTQYMQNIFISTYNHHKNINDILRPPCFWNMCVKSRCMSTPIAHLSLDWPPFSAH